MTLGIQQRVDAIHRALQQLVGNLRFLGYRFDRPDRVLPGPAPNTESAIARIEREIGPLPLALKLFWTQIGSVDLSGRHAEWVGCKELDQLIVYPPSAAIVELDEYLVDRESRDRAIFTYGVPVAPDALHKADVSGGMWYNIDVPALADDPPLNEEPHHVTFLGYLELAIGFGGFPGLSGCPNHTWPIAAIRSGV